MKWYSSSKKYKWKQNEYNESKVEGIKSLIFTGEFDQEIDGFGGCFNELGQIALENLSKEKKNEILDMLFDPNGDGLRFNFCRMPIGASDYAERWYSHCQTPDDYNMKSFSIERDYKYLLPYMKEAYKRNPDIQLFASPWSPPVWMKKPPAYNYGNLIMEENMLRAYALYLAKFIKAYEKEGIKIHQIHVQNEPMSSQKFPSCIIRGEEFAEFIGKYLGPKFEEEKLETEIWLGTLNGPENDHRYLDTTYNKYANFVLSDKKAYQYIKGVSYQWAGKHAMQVTRESWPEVKLIQSENECGDGNNTWEYAKYVFELFRHYLSNGASAYVYWNMVLNNGGESTWGWKQNSLFTIDEECEDYTIHHEYYIMKHFSRYLQKGAKRMVLKGHSTGNAIAFQNPDGSVVLVVQNPFERVVKLSLNINYKEYSFMLEADTINTMVL